MYNFREWEPEDVKTLWEWVKNDPSAVSRWNVLPVGSELELLLVFYHLMVLEQRGCAALRAIDEIREGTTTLVGFVGAFPILPDRSAYVHMILSPTKRGNSKELVAAAIQEAREIGISSLVVSFGVEEVGLCQFVQRLGFKEEQRQFVLR